MKTSCFFPPAWCSGSSGLAALPPAPVAMTTRQGLAVSGLISELQGHRDMRTLGELPSSLLIISCCAQVRAVLPIPLESSRWGLHPIPVPPPVPQAVSGGPKTFPSHSRVGFLPLPRVLCERHWGIPLVLESPALLGFWFWELLLLWESPSRSSEDVSLAAQLPGPSRLFEACFTTPLTCWGAEAKAFY